MKEPAESVNKIFKEFTYAVSHDLGTPLRAMVEFSKLLKNEYPADMSQDMELYLSMIVENGQKAQAMLKGLLEYSRLNTVVRPMLPTDCNELLECCKKELSIKIVRQKAELVTTPLPTLPTDSDQMKRLFLILLDNALTFHAPTVTPHVSISAEQRKQEWIFTVRDNGIGVDAKFHERIFEPFKRLHADGEYPGIGMGLALAKKVVDRHGGHIWLDSPPGQGTAFMFSIPEQRAA